MATVLFACWLVVLGGALSFANCFALFLLSFSNKCYGNKKKVQKKRMEVKSRYPPFPHSNILTCICMCVCECMLLPLA